ncbi:Rossmann-like domain-containing protein [Vulcanisaeta distributa]|uniref:Heavy-metal chelation domain-containing protein n=1 Tax=Vulcanisaeta distributa (strain DSM 14429 / JCM 11212 / NBRC 100878 / IC-017) TaxID=572478 RepID=E1QQS8_VULDI|nr:DUF364 domain-containing protein [Vulcanisaeta distributa]ADN51690.1 protein of unknown function DUF364 [Vulcanisaeta distributa DSM 14429]
MRFIEVLASRAMDLAGDLSIVDYCICLRATYVVVSDGRREAIGMAHVSYEDLHGIGRVMEPSIDYLPNMVIDVNPLNRVLGLALINAISQYHITEVRQDELELRSPVCVVGLMRPLIEELRSKGLEVYVFERSPYLRGDNAYSDVEEELLIPRCGTVYITGMALLNFTIDRLLDFSRGINVLIGPSASLLPELVKGLGIHYIESMKFTDVKTVKKHLRLGGYVSMKVHSNLGIPYRFKV